MEDKNLDKVDGRKIRVTPVKPRIGRRACFTEIAALLLGVSFYYMVKAAGITFPFHVERPIFLLAGLIIAVSISLIFMVAYE